MMNQVKQILPLLDYLSKCSKNEQKKFIASAKPYVIKLLSDLCLNFNKKNITTNAKHIKKLQPYAKLISSLCKKSLSIKKRRSILQKGGFLSNFLPLLLPLLSQLFLNKISK